jgi:hypothetical protein
LHEFLHFAGTIEQPAPLEKATLGLKRAPGALPRPPRFIPADPADLFRLIGQAMPDDLLANRCFTS